MATFLLAIDQGTTSTRAILFTPQAEMVNVHQLETKQSFPQLGWVEQDPEEIWQNTLNCCKAVLANQDASQVAAIGITNQRETTILWDKATGKPIYPAIIWQDRRTTEICQSLAAHPIQNTISDKTGLIVDPYFSATKIIWLLENVPGARNKAEKGELLFGTIDTFLLWHLTQGRVHATDATNASRTLLFNIKTQEWDDEILKAFNIPKNLLPKVLNSADDFGKTEKSLLGAEIPICALIGDQQAALVGQACFKKGMAKVTFGTGCFMVLNTGDQIVHSSFQLLSTVAYRLKGKVTYALEGSTFSAGTIVKWMRDKLKIISKASEADTLAESLHDNGGVYMIPAFTGLGAPYWNPNVRAAIVGMSSDTGVAHIARAGLEAVCYQANDLFECAKKDGMSDLFSLRVDGGMAASHWLLNFLASLLDVKVERPKLIESTALGAMLLAGLQSGIFQSLEDIENHWQSDKIFIPAFDKSKYQVCYSQWKAYMSMFQV